jgi:hypothetical protein
MVNGLLFAGIARALRSARECSSVLRTCFGAGGTLISEGQKQFRKLLLRSHFTGQWRSV